MGPNSVWFLVTGFFFNESLREDQTSPDTHSPPPTPDFLRTVSSMNMSQTQALNTFFLFIGIIQLKIHPIHITKQHLKSRAEARTGFTFICHLGAWKGSLKQYPTQREKGTTKLNSIWHYQRQDLQCLRKHHFSFKNSEILFPNRTPIIVEPEHHN